MFRMDTLAVVDGRARRWVEAATSARSVRSVRSLTYGISSSLELLEVDGRALVLRCYDRPERIADAEHDVANEGRALAAARGVLGSLVPELVAADAAGADAGCPSLLMTYLPGAPVLFDLDTEPMADVMTELHASPVPADLEPAQHWFHEDRLAVPSWTRRPDAWTNLISILRRPVPIGEAVFLHRDLHHGNLLWSEGRISGVVDWPCACAGPRGVDVAHTRSNLALVNGVDVADRFLASYASRVAGYEQDPWWDAAALIGHVQEDFAGLLAFSSFGAGVTLEHLAANAERFVESLTGAA
jgi:aminoglycoside phosphotransferase (APT) family kinase protein